MSAKWRWTSRSCGIFRFFGEVLNGQTLLTYLAYPIIIVLTIVFYKTKFGVYVQVTGGAARRGGSGRHPDEENRMDFPDDFRRHLRAGGNQPLRGAGGCLTV